MFGMGLGMDMGLGLGMQVGMMQGMMMGQMMMMDNAMMMGGMGMGYGYGGWVWNGRGFGRCLPGCMRPCCRTRIINCGPNCTGPCCMPSMNYQYQYRQPQQQFLSPPQNNYSSSQQTRSPQQKFIIEEKQQQVIVIKRPKKKVIIQQQEQQKVLVKKYPNQKIVKQQQIFVKQVPRQIKQNKVIYNDKLQIFNDASSAAFTNQGYQQNHQKWIPQQKYQQLVLYSGKLYIERVSQWQQTNPNLSSISFSNIPIKFITKIKVKRDSPLPNCALIKITAQRKNIFFCSQSKEHCQYFIRAIWAKMYLLNKYNDMHADLTSVEGIILRKSFFMGNWQKKYVRIDIETGLALYQNQNCKPNLQIDRIPQLWTRFQIICGQYMNVKLKYNGIKYEFGIPCNEAIKWLKAFYSLLRIF